jgi:hypothetical protein
VTSFGEISSKLRGECQTDEVLLSKQINCLLLKTPINAYSQKSCTSLSQDASRSVKAQQGHKRSRLYESYRNHIDIFVHLYETKTLTILSHLPNLISDVTS